jgi:hypothetical protein
MIQGQLWQKKKKAMSSNSSTNTKKEEASFELIAIFLKCLNCMVLVVSKIDIVQTCLLVSSLI